MANKLEEYKLNKPIIYSIPELFKKRREAEAYSNGFEAGHDEGFDVAIALNLPAKFAEWKRKDYRDIIIEDKEAYMPAAYTSHKTVFYSIQSLYQYWLDNILKLG